MLWLEYNERIFFIPGQIYLSIYLSIYLILILSYLSIYLSNYEKKKVQRIILTNTDIWTGTQEVCQLCEATLSFIDFSKAFDYIHRRKMELILLTYGLPKETITAIMMLYRNTKVKVRSPDGDTDFLDIVAGILQGDTLALYLFITRLHTWNADRSNKRKWVSTKRWQEADDMP